MAINPVLSNYIEESIHILKVESIIESSLEIYTKISEKNGSKFEQEKIESTFLYMLNRSLVSENVSLIVTHLKKKN